jgi:hypothetical protein
VLLLAVERHGWRLSARRRVSAKEAMFPRVTPIFDYAERQALDERGRGQAKRKRAKRKGKAQQAQGAGPDSDIEIRLLAPGLLSRDPGATPSERCRSGASRSGATGGQHNEPRMALMRRSTSAVSRRPRVAVIGTQRKWRGY